jgi:RNA polymerase sigma-70 factor, ECF subfamily
MVAYEELPPDDSAARMKPLGSAVPPPDERAAADANLMRQVATGDRAAFGNLYDRFAGPLYATAVRILSDAGEAQDVVHDAFVALWEKAATFDAARGSAFSFAVTLLRNRAIDRLRMRRRRSELLAASAPTDLAYGQSAEKSADASAASADDAQSVRLALAQLPAEQQRALELAFFGGLTQEEIAQKLSEPLGTVKARIRRALLKLRATLKGRS